MKPTLDVINEAGPRQNCSQIVELFWNGKRKHLMKRIKTASLLIASGSREQRSISSDLREEISKLWDPRRRGRVSAAFLPSRLAKVWIISISRCFICCLSQTLFVRFLAFAKKPSESTALKIFRSADAQKVRKVSAVRKEQKQDPKTNCLITARRH